MPEIGVLQLHCLNLSRVGIPAERLAKQRCVLQQDQAETHIMVQEHIAPLGKLCLKPGTDPPADTQQHAKYPRGLEKELHEHRPTLTPRPGANPGDLGTQPLASLQKAPGKINPGAFSGAFASPLATWMPYPRQPRLYSFSVLARSREEVLLVSCTAQETPVEQAGACSPRTGSKPLEHHAGHAQAAAAQLLTWDM